MQGFFSCKGRNKWKKWCFLINVTDAISYAEDSSKTILTSTNLTPKKLQSKYDERTLDRLRRCTVVKFEGVSLRDNQTLWKEF